MSNIAARARRFLAARPGGIIAADELGALCDGAPLEQAMQQLVAVAANYARPEVSGYRVGAVGLTASGALVLGTNFEFAGMALAQSVHAEQCLVANAAAAGETGLSRIAISAPPCGHCRQFLRELEGADDLLVTLPDAADLALSHYLPHAFGPADLGAAGGLLRRQDNRLACPPGLPPLQQRAFAAANGSYAPYSNAPAGAALQLADGTVFTGGYLENAAFNPSLPALQAAWAAMLMAGSDPQALRAVAVCQLARSAIDHASAARDFLAHAHPAVAVEAAECKQASD